MGAVDGLVAVVTGGGRGIGREHALLLAREGARVVVNDLGGSGAGTGAEQTPAEDVAAEITGAGGEAVANYDDVADETGASSLVRAGVEAFGKVDIVINNAGVLRDRMLVNLEPEDFDVVVRVNLRGTYLVMRAAANHWRERSKAGEQISAAVVNTASESGLFANVGQSNYGAAKTGVATMTQIAAKELRRYGVRVNAIAPRARTRLTEELLGERATAKEDRFDYWHPGNVAPFVVYLASPLCELSGQIFMVGGGQMVRIRPFEADPEWQLEKHERWSVEDLSEAAAQLAPPAPISMPVLGS
jgi:NAD(P)-dependent dehydrogenase (short-subunit alcohol dehydrogenase family)